MSEMCPHPARSGRHEEYARPDGSSFCRACGVELGFWKDVTPKPKALPAPDKEPKNGD